MLSNAQKEILIMSPWLSENVTEQVLPRLKKAADRGVHIGIIYGISAYSSSTNQRNQKSERQLQRYQRELGDALIIKKDNTHVKICICDNAYLIGSCNLLSFEGNYEKEETWKELCFYGKNIKKLQHLKKEYFRNVTTTPIKTTQTKDTSEKNKSIYNGVINRIIEDEIKKWEEKYIIDAPYFFINTEDITLISGTIFDGVKNSKNGLCISVDFVIDMINEIITSDEDLTNVQKKNVTFSTVNCGTVDLVILNFWVFVQKFCDGYYTKGNTVTAIKLKASMLSIARNTLAMLIYNNTEEKLESIAARIVMTTDAPVSDATIKNLKDIDDRNGHYFREIISYCSEYDTEEKRNNRIEELSNYFDKIDSVGHFLS